MKNWLATANFMYRQVFVKSLVSSASLVVVPIVLPASFPKSAVARSAARSLSAPISAGGCAVPPVHGPPRSVPGRRRHRRCTRASRKVLRDVAGRARIDGAPKRDQEPVPRCGAIWSTAFSKIVIEGPRNSSTGVPMTTTRLSVRSIIEPLEPKVRRPVGSISARSSSAPVSRRASAPSRSGRASPGPCHRCRRTGRPSRTRGSTASRRGRRRRARRRRRGPVILVMTRL